jgi:GDP-L-fucose synthase
LKIKVLVFGSNGMVGSSIIRLMKKSEKVSDLLASTRKDTDLFLLNDTKKTIEKFNPDLIINAAARVGGINANNTHRTEFIIENLKINMNILESIVDYPNVKVINLGSSCIYPLDSPNPIKEEFFMDGKLEPTNSPYAMAKLTSIEIGRTINHQNGNKIINLMPTNLYGINDFFSETDSHVIPGLISRMSKAKIHKQNSFKIWGTGKPLREFLFVDDLADAINFLLDVETEHDLLNVGSGEEISIADLAVKIKNLLKFDGELEFDKNMPDGNPRKLLDSSLINDLGWKSKTSLDEGLKITVDWFDRNYKLARK